MINTPNFFIIGTQKAGTTTLFNILKQHPDIYLPEKKELHFFDSDTNYKKGFDWYLSSFFANIENESAIGEITPSYCFDSNTPRRILESCGESVKFIFIVRNPIDRALSHYNMNKSRDDEKYDFETALETEKQRLKTLSSKEQMKFNYLERGYYSEQLENYFKFFAKENILVLSFEKDFLIDKRRTITLLEDFLEVSNFNNYNLEIHSNKSELRTTKPKIVKYIKSSLMGEKLSNKLNQSIFIRLRKIFYRKKNNIKINLQPETRKYLQKKYFPKEHLMLNKILDNSNIYWD